MERWVNRGTSHIRSFCIVVAALCCVAGIVLYSSHPVIRTLNAGTRQYHLEVAATEAAQTKGLGGRKHLAPQEGMVFIFKNDKPRCFWMLDMHVSLDILWVDHDQRVVYIERDVSPNTYPHTFCPPQAARYVIELAADEATRAGIHIGEVLHF